MSLKNEFGCDFATNRTPRKNKIFTQWSFISCMKHNDKFIHCYTVFNTHYTHFHSIRSYIPLSHSFTLLFCAIYICFYIDISSLLKSTGNLFIDFKKNLSVIFRLHSSEARKKNWIECCLIQFYTEHFHFVLYIYACKTICPRFQSPENIMKTSNQRARKKNNTKNVASTCTHTILHVLS